MEMKKAEIFNQNEVDRWSDGKYFITHEQLHKLLNGDSIAIKVYNEYEYIYTIKLKNE